MEDMEVAVKVHNIVSKLKQKYKDRFEFYFTGGYARNENGFRDYDVAIYDTEDDNKDWEYLLGEFYKKKESDGKPIDAQISQYIPVVIKMTGKELYNNRDTLVKRYTYSDKNLSKYNGQIRKDCGYVKYTNINGNLWEKEIMLVNHEHRKMGLDRISRIYKRI
jgi:hypothetical protein|tara:strand:+ start:408 stop:896 length:489 start_codon:yes stop_codon:yes gene_type:complete